ncbi:ATP-dependent Clp protease adapter ClpS [Schaalia sp. 19OD2882]|uniref:ATP-dependent Clp protease adapter ClpS n=1 Tax=Schaalia sp. 19OD2882 TaxID=2794089 RepID=UPI001C1F134B|nr:ATP-dependent Clp protease adapter ClpS [Schaalia sp. 19OD2882]QWW20178.1 ATP-dependent Clp protease adapter ClpS [Schaalia sp. 19OD2882]
MSADVEVRPDSRVDTVRAPLSTWRTVVWDDPVNLMEYVTEVFLRHFGYPRSTCEALMLQVHVEGRAVVSTGMRERMEADVVALHGYGLRATLERDE